MTPGEVFSLSNIFNNLILLGRIFYIITPFIVPVVLGFLCLSTWLSYIRTRYIANQDYILLEIKIPREITKSPLAMEVFLTSLYQKTALTYTDTYWIGKTKVWFSLEIISLEGQIRFFIWSPIKWKNMIETQIYAQYPDVEIQEVEDYASHIKHNPKERAIWGTYYKLEKPEVYPIKTYIDYGIEKEVKEEEFKVDPMTAFIEYLGSMKKGEQVWFQILIQAHKKEGIREGRLFKKKHWKEAAKKELQSIRDSLALDETHQRIPTEGEKEQMTAIERSMSKFPFECMIRAVYIARNDSFNEISIPALIGSVRQYNSNNLNGFKLGWYTDHSDNSKDWINIFSLIFPPWKKIMRKKRDGYEKQMLEAYKMRSFFQLPHKHWNAEPFILTTEEIATIYHFPGGVATTPTLPRIPSKRAKPPPNLPV